MFKRAFNVGLPIDIKQLKIDVATEQMALDGLRAMVSKCMVGKDEKGNPILLLMIFLSLKKLKNLLL